MEVYADEVSKAEKIKEGSTANDTKRNKKRKDREAKMESEVQNLTMKAVVQVRRKRQGIDWNQLRRAYPMLKSTEIKKVQEKCHQLCRNFKNLAHRHAYRLSTRGVLEDAKDGFVPFQEGTLKALPDWRLGFVPIAVLENISPKNQDRLEELNNKLLVRLRGGGEDVRPLPWTHYC